jgi:RNA polymerase sigma-70 factor (ECF subfamily)
MTNNQETSRTSVVACYLERIVRLHGRSLQAKALSFTGNRETARDLVQASYERALRAQPLWPSDGKALRWLYVVMKNLHLDQMRARGHRREVPADGIEDRGHLPEANLPAAVTRQQIEKSLTVLSARLRPVYELHALEGYSYAEIALRLRLPAATVGTRIFRARAQLRRALVDETAAAA